MSDPIEVLGDRVGIQLGFPLGVMTARGPVMFEDAAAVNRFEVNCRHELDVTAVGGSLAPYLPVVHGCRRCVSWFLAYGPAWKGERK